MSARKRTRAHFVGGGIIDPKWPTLDFVEEAISPTLDTARVLLRRVFFLNAEKSRYVAVGFYPARNYQVLVEFGGLRIAPIILTEQHVRTLVEHLPKLYEIMCRGENYSTKAVYSVYRLLEPTALRECTKTSKTSFLSLPICVI